MQELITNLKNFILFEDLDATILVDALKISKYEVKHYSAEEIIAFESTPCTQLGLIIKGSISISKIYPSGRTVSVTTLEEGDIFGEVILFSNHSIYPSTVIAASDCTVLLFEKNKFIAMCDYYPKIYKNLLQAFSDRILLLNQKITNLSFKSIRQKIIHFLFNTYKNQKNIYLNIKITRSEWAELLGIPRPSLSRELVKMKDDGLIDFDKSTIRLMNLDALEDELFK
ncbi:CRP-like cAMP-binding protein [Natranaerovirga pectinivora]|uniref:CRP-like cAMP-binding protein n=1 Tax=Natranaerovirga pectinivora TaxID=682400 RepID=A0A4R3MPV4_9FIRM|nr:Crp/Fnr family transcriptional regulator [Natranaerovirga pectinivora]TCT16814.1 CRP-like cAMP-binding protein [Natranaerovirga pectinivora]